MLACLQHFPVFKNTEVIVALTVKNIFLSHTKLTFLETNFSNGEFLRLSREGIWLNNSCPSAMAPSAPLATENEHQANSEWKTVCVTNSTEGKDIPEKKLEKGDDNMQVSLRIKP